MPSAEEKFHQKETINGIEISVGWDDGHRKYVMYFPQVAFTEGEERGVYDQIIKISEDAEEAKKVFEYAEEQAAREKDVYNVYKKVEEYIVGLES